ncbi:MAG: ATP-binding protein [Acidobacteria bacterium]|nr:ATP-binding protein [Acidobacteriota bacterium]
MFDRLIRTSHSNSFFLFGARGTGKTFLLKQWFNPDNSLYIDLLDPDETETFSLSPQTLVDRIAALPETCKWVVIDEVQKVPKLLDLVHQQIESTSLLFALSGSSARKLKRGGADLLAGRAFVYNLFPLSIFEIGGSFNLQEALEWGTLPRIFSLATKEDKAAYLRTYSHTYLQQEIISEQLIRKLDPFRRFLPVAAQASGTVLNYSKIARDVGTSTNTVQSYFEILEDTLIGFKLEPFHRSVRKRQSGSPKFFLFDTGVQRSLARLLNVPLVPSTYAFGVAFEHFVINEIMKLNGYLNADYECSYLRTKDGVEIDLIIERPGEKLALIEIKSSRSIRPEHVAPLAKIARDIPGSDSYCFSLEKISKTIGSVQCMHWEAGLRRLFNL